MKVLPKILLILVLVMGLFVSIPQGVYAADKKESKKKEDSASTASSYLENLEGDRSGSNVDSLQSVVKKILGFLQIASGLIAVVMIAWTGFRYIIETPEMKSELKKNMIPIVVGILLVFFAASIAKFIIGMFES